MAPLSRRQFLAGAAGVTAVGAAGYAGRDSIDRVLGRQKAAAAHATASPSPPGGATAGGATAGTGRILVLVTLYGGNDGLNTVIPYTDAAYHAGRPTLGYAADAVLPLDAALGLHPALTGLKRLWDDKHLAVVLGVGYPHPNRSHFRSMDIWQSAVPETDEPTGWLGRWLDTLPHDPMRALSLGATLPLLLQGRTSAAASIPTGKLALPGGPAMTTGFTALETPHAGQPDLAALVSRSGTDLLSVIHDVGTILASHPVAAAPSGALEPTPSGAAGAGAGAAASPTATGGELASQLDVVARLIAGGAPTQLYCVSLGGFDTHAGERDNHDRLMAELDAGIAGFLSGLAGTAAAGRVVVATYSEFGRRVSANASGGTDHGTAAPLFVAGGPVIGGLYGTQPSLTDLDQGDLRFSTDFRCVYATLAEKVLGTDPKAVLNGASFPTLPLLA